MSTRNKIANVNNRFQGQYPRVLFVCSAGLLRSATAGAIFSSPPYNWNTRNAGSTVEYALIDATDVLVEWADHVFFMEPRNLHEFKALYPICVEDHKEKIHILNISDNYSYRDPQLIIELEQRLKPYMEKWACQIKEKEVGEDLR